MTTLMMLAAILFAPANPADPAARPAADPAAIENKLPGEWRGAIPCSGVLNIRPDGTFKFSEYGPGAVDRGEGTWKMRWDALPPTLVLTWKISDQPGEVGKSTEVKVIRLNDSRLTIQYTQVGGEPDWETEYRRPASR